MISPVRHRNYEIYPKRNIGWIKVLLNCLYGYLTNLCRSIVFRRCSTRLNLQLLFDIDLVDDQHRSSSSERTSFIDYLLCLQSTTNREAHSMWSKRWEHRIPSSATLIFDSSSSDRTFVPIGFHMSIHHRLDACISGHRKNAYRSSSTMHHCFNRSTKIYPIYSCLNGVQDQVR